VLINAGTQIFGYLRHFGCPPSLFVAATGDVA
jgi:hypothetical protein